MSQDADRLTIPAQITALSQQYDLLYREGDPEQVRAIARQVADLAHEVPAEAGAEVAESLYTLAQSYERTGSYPTALALLEKVLELRRAVFGPEHPSLPQTLHSVALIYGFMGRYAAAEPFLLEAWELGRKVLGETHPAYATIVDSLGVLYSRTGQYAAAKPLLQQAIALKCIGVGPAHPSYATSVNNLALLYDRMGRFDKAEPLYCSALEIQRKSLGEQHPALAHSLNNLAGLYVEFGNYAAAESLLQQARDIAVAYFGEQHPDVALYWGNLAELHARTGNYTEALQLHHEALQILEQVVEPDNPSVAITLNNMAWLYERLGDYDTAEDFYWRALHLQYQALGPNHPDLAVTNTNLAHFFAEALGDIVRAESTLQNVLAIRRSVLGDSHPEVAESLRQLAALYHDAGNYAAAEPLYRQALAIYHTVFGESHQLVAATLHQLMALALVTGQPAVALSLAQQATALDDRALSHLLSFGSERHRMAYGNSVRSEFFRVLSLIWHAFGDTATAVQWALELVWKRKAIGAEALAVQRDTILGGRYPALQPKLRELATWRAQIARLSIDGPGAAEPQTYQRTLSRWQAEQARLEAELARAIPEMSLETYLQTTSLQAVADTLPPASALVEFVRLPIFDFHAPPAHGAPQWQPARYVAFVLLAGMPDSVKMLDVGEATALEQLLAAYLAPFTGRREATAALPTAPEMHAPVTTPEAVRRTAISEGLRQIGGRRPASQPPDMQAGMALRQALFDPLVPVLAGRTRLFLAPDGDLSRLPFEVLPLEHGRFVLDVYELSYLSVGRDVLRFTRSDTGQPGTPVVAADPDFDLATAAVPQTPAGTPFAPLQGTRLEGLAVADLLQVQPWLRDHVLETSFKAMHSPRLLHVATHGFFMPDSHRELTTLWSGVQARPQVEHPLANPLLRSGLVLAGANTWLHQGELYPEAEDGFLTAEDVTGLDLLDTALVVLSACDTGLGDIQVGEGVFGLQRAFTLAGARTLVMSLWKVPDAQTQELMVTFYQMLLAGRPRAAALRAAQLAIKDKYPNPLTWGAFICQGDPGLLAWPGTPSGASLPAAP